MSVVEDIIKAMQFQESKEYAKAEFFFKKALMTKEHCPPEVYIGLGLTYEKMDKIEDAIISYNKAIELDNTLHEAYSNLANVYLSIDDKELAKSNYNKAISLNKNDVNLYNILSQILNEEGSYTEAIAVLKQYYELNKDNLVIINNIGFSYLKLKDYKKAFKYFFKALEIAENDDVYNNISNAYIMIGKYKKAKQYSLKALELNKKNVSAYVNLASTYEKTNRLKKAIDIYKKALRIDPSCVNAKYNLGFVYLLSKNYIKGFKNYESRLLKDDFKKYTNIATMWEDQELDKKNILLHREQGLGDTIQFLRYLKLLDKKDINYSLLVQESLEKLILYNFPNIDINKSLDNIDYTFPIMSLPNKFDISFIKPIKKYLDVDSEDVKKFSKAIKKDKFNIGIVWQGSTTHPNDKNRSFELSNFYDLSKIPKVQLYSLQIEKNEVLEDLPKDIDIINLGKKFKNFYDTACAIKNLDLVISIDTSVVHLSGALGVKTFVLVPFHPDWRWGLENDNSDWYKNMKIFRQSKNLEWKNVFNELEKEIKEMVSYK